VNSVSKSLLFTLQYIRLYMLIAVQVRDFCHRKPVVLRPEMLLLDALNVFQGGGR